MGLTRFLRPWGGLLVISMLAALLTGGRAYAQGVAVGQDLSSLAFAAADRPEDAALLGAPAGKPFSLKDLRFGVFILEVVGVYCSYCHEQAPLFNDFHKRLTRAKLAGPTGPVRMAAVASGATIPELEHLRTHSSYAYPVLRDEDYSLHKALGEPKTPYTIVLDGDGKVLKTFEGVVKDIDGLFTTVKGWAKGK